MKNGIFNELVEKVKHQGVFYVIVRTICKPIDSLLISLFRLFPIKKNYIALRSTGDFTDNARAFYDYMIRNGYNEKYKIIWFVAKDKEYDKQKNVVFAPCLKAGVRFKYDYYQAVSKFIIYTHVGENLDWRKDQVFIATTHSVDQLKAHPTHTTGTYPYYVLCCSEMISQKRQAYYSNGNMLVLGLPRIDFLYQHKNCFRQIFNSAKKGKLIVAMETFKQNNSYNSWIDGEIPNKFALNVVSTSEQLVELDKYLGTHGCKMLIKIHPLQDLSYVDALGYEFENIKYLTSDQLSTYDIHVNELLENADILLTDYSSVFYEFLLLDRPIGFTIGDIESYTRGFITTNIVDEMPGCKIKNFEDLLSFIESSSNGKDEYKEARKKIRDSRFKYLDARNSERLYNWIETH